MLLCDALSCGERWIRKTHETTRGCLRFCLQTRVFILPWMMWEIENKRSIKWIGKSQFLLESWKWKNVYWRICAIGMRGISWCQVQHGWVGMGLRNPLGFRFEWRANGGEWWWLTNTNNQASSSSWVSPITIKSKHPSKFSVVNVMNMQSFMDKLNKMSIFNMNEHHWKW